MREKLLFDIDMCAVLFFLYFFHPKQGCQVWLRNRNCNLFGANLTSLESNLTSLQQSSRLEVWHKCSPLAIDSWLSPPAWKSYSATNSVGSSFSAAKVSKFSLDIHRWPRGSRGASGNGRCWSKASVEQSCHWSMKWKQKQYNYICIK